MKEFTVTNDGMAIEVHRPGCSKINRSGTAWSEMGSSKEEIAASVYFDQIREESMDVEQGIGELEFKPCVGDLPTWSMPEIVVDFGYQSRGIDGSTWDNDSKTFHDIVDAWEFCQAFVNESGAMKGGTEVDVRPTNDPERLTWVFKAHWSSIGEPHTIVSWAEFTAEYEVF